MFLFFSVITLIKGKVEEVTLPVEKVDIIEEGEAVGAEEPEFF